MKGNDPEVDPGSSIISERPDTRSGHGEDVGGQSGVSCEMSEINEGRNGIKGSSAYTPSIGLVTNPDSLMETSNTEIGTSNENHGEHSPLVEKSLACAITGSQDVVTIKPLGQRNGNGNLARQTSCYDNAPDGGWGWVVTFAAFMVGVILDGISFSFGIFYRELLLHFRESKSLTSWIISVLNGTYLGIGKRAS